MFVAATLTDVTPEQCKNFNKRKKIFTYLKIELNPCIFWN